MNTPLDLYFKEKYNRNIRRKSDTLHQQVHFLHIICRLIDNTDISYNLTEERKITLLNCQMSWNNGERELTLSNVKCLRVVKVTKGEPDVLSVFYHGDVIGIEVLSRNTFLISRILMLDYLVEELSLT
jgi:hypothetical protein